VGKRLYLTKTDMTAYAVSERSFLIHRREFVLSEHRQGLNSALLFKEKLLSRLGGCRLTFADEVGHNDSEVPG
jgi:hypothetical protein